MSLPDDDLPDARIDELLHEVVVEEGMLAALLERVHGDGGQGSALRRATPRRDGRASFGRYWRDRSLTPSRRGSVAKVAAALLIVGAMATAIEMHGAREGVRRAASPGPRTVVTRPGQRAIIDLPDGSRAILAPSSELRYAISAREGAREVQLDGEAYFDVHHDAARPFRVHTRRALIEDRGTAFVVRAYPTDGRARVAVRAGSVTLRAPAAPDTAGVTLRQGDAAALDSSGTVVRLAEDPAADWGWITGRLVFDRTPLPAVLAQLGRWYDVDFRLDDSTLATQYFTGAFQASPLPQVLDILGPLVHARFERRGPVVTVTARSGRL